MERATAQAPQGPQGPQGASRHCLAVQGAERRKRGTLAAWAANPNRLLAGLRLPPLACDRSVHHLGKC